MISLLALALLAAGPSAAAPTGWKCNYARIQGDAAVVVRFDSRPGSRIVGRLAPGTIVYTCDESRTRVKIHFATPKAPCPTRVDGLDHRLASSCPSGWVRQDQVDVISG
jgi:hypothetical protein